MRLSSLSEREQDIATALIGDIDEDGYFRSSLEELSEGRAFDLSASERVLKVVQGFDPSGIGARNLNECLLIQIQQLGLKGTLVEKMVSHLENLEKKRYPVIAKALGVTIQEVVQAASVLERLEPKPGRPFFRTDNLFITPDVFPLNLLFPGQNWGFVKIGDQTITQTHVEYRIYNQTISTLYEEIWLRWDRGNMWIKDFLAGGQRSQRYL